LKISVFGNDGIVGLRSAERKSLVKAADRFLTAWRAAIPPI